MRVLIAKMVWSSREDPKWRFGTDELPRALLKDWIAQEDPRVAYTDLFPIGGNIVVQVSRAKEARSGRDVCLKAVRLASDVDTEVLVLARQLAHPNLQHVLAVHDCDGRLWLAEESVCGSVEDLLEQYERAPLSEAQIARACRDALRGLALLRRRRVLLGRLAADGLLLDAAGSVRLSLEPLWRSRVPPSPTRSTVVATPYWAAPETVCGQAAGCAADIWALGMAATEMAEGEPPFLELPPLRALALLSQRDLPQLGGTRSPQLRDFVRCCLQRDPYRRPPPQELLQHPFLASACEGDELYRALLAAIEFGQNA